MTAYHHHLVIRSKLAAPRLHRRTLSRPRINARLLEAADYRLTLVQAGAGYGKSTALATFVSSASFPSVWYHLDQEDTDPLRFLLHLWSGFNQALDGFSAAPLALLEEMAEAPRSSTGDGGQAVGEAEQAAVWYAVVDALGNALAELDASPIALVLDDAHVLDQAPVMLRIIDRLIGRSPDTLRFILAGRYPVRLPNLIHWRVRGDLMEITQAELAFTDEETASLFRDHYGVVLSDTQVTLLSERLEGWVMPLPLVWQSLQRDEASRPGGAAADLLATTLAGLSGNGSDLFTYLASEVISRQPEDVAQFLRVTSLLRHMSAGVCDHIRQATNSQEILRYLLENGLFVVGLGDGTVRYHHLFHDLLRQQLPPETAAGVHWRAATYYAEHDERAEAIYHYLAAARLGQTDGYEAAATLLEQLGRDRIRTGQLDLLSGWIDSLPPDVLHAHPPLLVYQGDIARLQCRFGEALGWYEQAAARSRMTGDLRGVGQALRGQARVYLDTVNPSQAEQLLQDALRLSDGEEDRESRARLLELLAENLINRGRSDDARDYQQQARALREAGPDSADLSVRLLLRTGRLDQARSLLEERMLAERDNPVMRPRAHRETFLLLSLVLALMGEADGAAGYARAGVERGRTLQSPFVTAVGHMRQGHAWLLRKDRHGYDAAEAAFREAIDMIERLGAPRLKVEAYWGLCHVHGLRGEIALAEEVAATGIELARSAGDEWVEADIRTALGASHVLAGNYEAAVPWLARAYTAFHDCGDTHGEAAVRLWQSLLWWRTGDDARLTRDMADLMRLVQEHGYDHLFKAKTLLGPPDERALVPLLLYAREQGSGQPWGRTADRLLAGLGLDSLRLHPGYQLRVQTLGQFRVWRGGTTVESGDWKRQNARLLFQLLITHRDRLLDREQIGAMLWPEAGPEEVDRDFKVAYSTLCNVLEPDRARNAPSAYIWRDGSRYGLRPEADVWLDAAEFEALVEQGDAAFMGDAVAALASYEMALDLYEGDYLQAIPFAEWGSEQRERLLTHYLRTAERVATLQVEDEAWSDVVETCQRILARDNCWEQAYRFMMIAYAQMENRAQALRTYQRCTVCLQQELGIAPSAATQETYYTIVSLPADSSPHL